MNLQRIKLNQTEIVQGDITVFFSYNTPVAFIKGSHGYRTEKRWSVTTSKHIGQFFNRHYVNNVTEVFQEDINKLVA